MIVGNLEANEIADKNIVYDLGRPSYFNDGDFEFWGKIYEFIETTDIRIAVSSAYDTMKEYYFDKQFYGSGGHVDLGFFTDTVTISGNLKVTDSQMNSGTGLSGTFIL